MEHTIQLHDRKFAVLITAERIAEAVQRVAARISADYASTPQPPLLIGVLNGSFVFLADLVRAIDRPVEVSFVKLSSYEGTDSTGTVRELIGLDHSIRGRDVIIVEDIVETGTSIEHMIMKLEQAAPRSVAVCTLFFKPAAYSRARKVEYAALEIGNEFIVGYGLDYNQLGRNLPSVYVALP